MKAPNRLLMRSALFASLVMGFAPLRAGAADRYRIQPGDTLWDIAETYLQKNTGGRRYILEFKQGIIELNPDLQHGNVVLHPGDQIRINYWIAKGGEGNED